MEDNAFHILGISGSLRKGSFNRGLLRAAVGLVPDGVTLTVHEIDQIPHFNADVMAAGDPPVVHEFKEAIRSADALLIATPENNYSIPGVLKNAIDWASRPNKTSVLRGKPVGIMGASSGEGGTVRAQLALRQVFLQTNSLVMVQPELRVPLAAQKFDEAGELVDEQLRTRLASFLAALVDWSRLVAGPAS